LWARAYLTGRPGIGRHASSVADIHSVETHLSPVFRTRVRWIPLLTEVKDVSDHTRHAPLENPEKDTSDWATGGEPMTGPQRSYLHTLAQEAGRDVPEDLTKAQASELIDELRQPTGRGAD
jgi:Protein of unknown function (DUF3072)